MIKLSDPNIKVIVFGQHYMNSLGQVRSFGEVGCRPDVVWQSVVAGPLSESKSKDEIALSKYIDHFEKVSTLEDGLEYIIREYHDRDTRYIISTDSDLVVSLLNSRYDELKDRFVFFNASQPGRLNQYLAKDAQCRLAEQFGLRVPRSELVHRGELPKVVTYPLVTKTVDSFSRQWKKNYNICRTEQELLEAYESIPLDEVLLQEFIERENEVAFEGISFNQGEELYMPIQGEYIRIGDFGYGSWKRNEAYHYGEVLKDKIQQIFKAIKYSGVFEIEFLKTKDGDLYFLEINFRHTQYNHALTDMGVNLCTIYAESELNGRLCVPDIDIQPRTVMNERMEYFAYIETKKIRLRDWIKDIKKTDSFYIYDRRDLKPLFQSIKKYLIMEMVQAFYRYRRRIRSLWKKTH